MEKQKIDNYNSAERALRALDKKFKEIIKQDKKISESIKQGEKVNVFDAIGMTTQEVKHSAFLAWLLNPKSPHHLGNKALKLFIEHLIPHNFSDNLFEEKRRTNATIFKEIAVTSTEDCACLYEDNNVDVKTEEVVFRDKNDKDGRIDIMIESEKANTVILIENKVFTGTHDNQLNRYEKGFENSLRKVIYVYLTPLGDTPEYKGQYQKNWCVCSYKTILQIVKQILKELPHIKENLRLRILLEDYIDIVNTEILKANKKIRDLCKSILRENREALEILKFFTDQSKQVIAICKSYLTEKFGNEITFLGNTTSGTLDFYTSRAKLYFEQLDGSFEQNGNYKFLYQIRKAQGYKYCWYINKVSSFWSNQQKILAQQNGKSLSRKHEGRDIEKTSFCNLCGRKKFLSENDLYSDIDEETLKNIIILGLNNFIKEIQNFEETYFVNC